MESIGGGDSVEDEDLVELRGGSDGDGAGFADSGGPAGFWDNLAN